MVCGFDEAGYRIVGLLCDLGEPVTVVAERPREEWVRAVEARGVLVRQGDPRDADVLVAAGLHEAAALIAGSDTDLVNLETALDAQRLRPDLPVVLRLFDQRLAAQLEKSFQIRRALAISALAAPVFASAALGERLSGSFSLDGRLHLVGQLPPRTIEDLAGTTLAGVAAERGLVALALRRGGAGSSMPDTSTKLEAGDQLTVLASATAWQAVAGSRDERTAAHRLPVLIRAARWLDPRRTLRLLSDAWREATPGLRPAFIMILLLILVSVGVFRHGLNISWTDALYFVVSTVTTTGYGDITPRDASVTIKLYACLLMVLGSAAFATLYSIITDLLVTARLQQLMGTRGIPESDHVVVVGLGNVGYRVIDELRSAQLPVVAIETNPGGRFVDAIRAHTPVILGDAGLRATLERAGVARARAVVCATSDDAINLSVSLAAKALDPRVRTVIRWSDASLADKIQRSLHVDVVMSPSRIAAPTFVAAALLPDVRQALVLEGHLLSILQRHVGPAWAGKTPRQVAAEHALTPVMRRPRGAPDFRPIAEGTALAEDDEVVLVAWRALAT